MENNLKVVPVVIIVLASLTGTFYTGYAVGAKSVPAREHVQALSNLEKGMPEDVDFSEFWEVWNFIDENYVPRKNGTSTVITTQDKVYGAIQGLTNSLEDPYTVYLPPADSKIFNEDISGNFEGVGMEVGLRDGVLTVVAPLEGSPAKSAGLKPGDKIVKIDDVSTERMSVDDGVKLIRGAKGTVVSLTVFREGETELLVIDVIRDVINIPTLEYHLRDDGIFVIRLFNFNRDSHNKFRFAMRDFVLSGSDKLILDLRGNPGGFLDASVDMAGWFLPTGKIIVQEDYGIKGGEIAHRSRGYDIFDEKNQKMVILIDRGSASASEILAGALSEQGVATLVGEKSYGKGSVQQLEKIGEGSLKITIARWLTPKGNSISENGLVPDVEVSLDSKNPEDDLQLEKAIEILNR